MHAFASFQAEQRGEMESLRIIDILMKMRDYRMGLIQTPDQLRFSYLAIIEGAKQILNRSTASQVDGDSFENVREALSFSSIKWNIKILSVLCDAQNVLVS